MAIYEIPNSVQDMFEQGETSYRIVDYTIQEMDNNQSMQFFLDCIGATDDNIEMDDGTQVVVKHPDFDHKLVIDSGGLGDFYSHGYNVTLLEVNGWLDFESNKELFNEEAKKNCLCKFEDGTVIRYDEEHPIEIMTHFKLAEACR